MLTGRLGKLHGYTLAVFDYTGCAIAAKVFSHIKINTFRVWLDESSSPVDTQENGTVVPFATQVISSQYPKSCLKVAQANSANRGEEWSEGGGTPGTDRKVQTPDLLI